jgi:hypothetical protein
MQRMALLGQRHFSGSRTRRRRGDARPRCSRPA